MTPVRWKTAPQSRYHYGVIVGPSPHPDVLEVRPDNAASGRLPGGVVWVAECDVEPVKGRGR